MTEEITSRTAFVFAGGGSLGAVEVGMLKALVTRGVHADFVVGASVGAINAAYFAGDPSVAGVARLEALWRGIRRRDVFPMAPFTNLLGLFARRDYLVRESGGAREPPRAPSSLPTPRGGADSLSRGGDRRPRRW